MEKKAVNSIKSIRRRLIMVVLRALVIVVALTVLAVLGTATYEINNKAQDNPFYRSPSTMLLEAYYIGHGGWDGVEILVNEAKNPDSQFPQQDWSNAIVIDGNSRVIIDHGRTDSSLVGQIYSPEQGEPISQIIVNGKIIGGIINDKREIPHPLRLTFSVINPVAEVSIGLAIFAIIIGVLLTRRVVNPIAEVIAAAEKVSAGDLSTRITPKRGNDDLSGLIDHFNEMTESLQKNDNERRQLLADIAHELRTPLSVLRGRLEGIVDGIYPVNDASIAPVLEETYLLERLVEDLRLLTLAETRQLHFEIRSINLNDIFERTINVFTPQADEKNITLKLQTKADLPEVLADAQRIEQVVGNIIDNALRYSNKDGVITIKAESIQDGVKVSITDTGYGVSADEVNRIFDRFYRSEKSRTRSTGGSGLGLAIVKQLIEAQGGQIGAENVEGGGLSIWFILPTGKI